MVHLTAEGLGTFFKQHPHAKTLDVRSVHEREDGGGRADHHVPWHDRDGTRNLHFLDLAMQRLSRDDYVLVLCRCGEHSHHAGSLLEAAGFRHVYNLLGGHDDLRADRTDAIPAGIAESLSVTEPES
jgi:rhodanese-related sulfurtransferase